MAENDDDHLKRKDRTKSSAWTHFGIKTAEDGNSVEEGIAICLYCKRSVVARNGNTSNLFSHLRTQHPAKYELAMKAKKKAKGKGKATGTLPRSGIQNSIDESFAQMKKYDRKSKRWQRLTCSNILLSQGYGPVLHC